VTNPPPPGNWGPPPQYGQGQPPYGPGPWPPQQGWGPPQPPKNNSLKWLLIGVAVLLVVAISVGATLLFTRDGGGGTTQAANGNPPATGDIASANDTGPVSVITEDPTCEPSRPIISTLAQRQRQGWTDRDIRIPASSWTPEQRSIHDNVAEAMKSAADRTTELARLTPHRVMRELYLQAIAYWRAYASAIPTYTEKDNSLAVVTTDLAGAIVSICAAIDYGSAESRGPLAKSSDAPKALESSTNIDSPARFISSSGEPTCADWRATSRQFDTDVAAWHDINPDIGAAEWTPEQRDVMNRTVSIMNQYADDLQTLGSRSENQVLSDFAALSAVYWRAFTASISSYTTADSYLSSTANYANFAVYYACEAAGS